MLYQNNWARISSTVAPATIVQPKILCKDNPKDFSENPAESDRE